MNNRYEDHRKSKENTAMVKKNKVFKIWNYMV